jgi:hypothetical protein
MLNKFSIYTVVFTLISTITYAQVNDPDTPQGVTGQQEGDRNVITTAMPFLVISPDSRSGAMGDVGAALSPDANAVQWNAARLAFVENEVGASLSYSPWLTRIGVDDMSISYLSGYYKLSREQVIAVDLKYFDLGSITFQETARDIPKDYSPKEFSISAAYARKLSDNLSGSMTARLARSNLFGSYQGGSGNADIKPATALAFDIGVFYTKPLVFNGNDAQFSSGLQISNIANKVSYSSADNEQFLPINLRLGTAFKTSLDAYNTLTISLDFNKLMVPSVNDTAKTLLDGMFSSFGDAPGGAKEEFREINIGTGAEYWYNNVFAVRAGYFYEHESKGGRQFFTAGLGFRYQVLGLDFSYLIPTKQDNPLADTLRFTASFNLQEKSNKESITE